MNVFLRLVFAATALTLFGFSAAHAQVNSWTKPTSGYWEELHWSLGVRPAFDHSIMFTNEGWKALAIGSITVRDFPSTLQITRLTVVSPTNSYNTFLLNYAGAQTPLQIAENFSLGSNSVLLSLASGLQVGNEFRIDGTVNQGALSEVAARMIYAGYGSNNPAVYNLSNGVLTVSNRMFVGYGAPATFTQDGGSNRATEIRLRAGGQYFLRGGDLAMSSMVVGDQSAGSFEQSGGHVSSTGRIRVGDDDISTFNKGSGRYTLSSGTLNAAHLAVGKQSHRLGAGGDGIFDQSGGSVSAGGIEVSGNRRVARYNLIAGELMTRNSAVGAGGGFVQAGGTHIVDGPLAVAGHYERSFEAIHAGYSLSNGLLRARSLNIGIGKVSQAGGTNDIAGDLVLAMEGAARSSYYLIGGRLNTYNTIVNPSFYGGFRQDGGLHSIIGKLDLSGPASPFTIGPGVPVHYTLTGGELIVDNIRVSTNAIFRHTGGTINQSGVLTLAGGNWESAAGTHQLGILELGAAPTNSSLTLSNAATTLRFTSSGLRGWA